MKEYAYPRIRDIRDMLRDIEKLMASYSNGANDFDRDFLTRVRDMMREADVGLSTALLIVADEDAQEDAARYQRFQGSL